MKKIIILLISAVSSSATAQELPIEKNETPKGTYFYQGDKHWFVSNKKKIRKTRKRLFEFAVNEGLAVHTNPYKTSVWYFGNQHGRISNPISIPMSTVGTNFKTEVKLSVFPIKWLNVGFMASMIPLKYKGNAAGVEIVKYAAKPLYQTGMFVNYNHIMGRFTIFGGGNFSTLGINYPANSQIMPRYYYYKNTESKYSYGAELGSKYKITPVLYACISGEYTWVNITNYYSLNAGIALKF